MNLSARAQFTPRGDLGRFVQTTITPGVVASVTAACKLVEDTAKLYVPVDTGALRDSIQSTVDDTGKTVVGHVNAGMFYASFVEYGTGRLGDPAVYHNPDWPGMRPQPYLRPAMDEARPVLLDLFRANISLGL